MILFTVYFCILAWVILFKMSFSFDELNSSRSINITPFSGSVIVNGKIYINEIINNILVFVPIGATDITDLIGNTIGGAIGIGIFYLFAKVFKNKTINIFNVLASIATLGLGSLLSILLLAN